MLDIPPSINNESYPILREEVEAAVKSLKKDKSAGVNNIPSERVQAVGEAMIDMLLVICNKIWHTGEWPRPLTQSLITTHPKKGNLQLCQNYRTISLISHPSMVMLRILLNRLKPQAEEIIKEEQAGFRAGRSTTEQIFSLRQGYLLSSTLFNIFLERKVADALEDYEGTVSIGCRTITNLRFADDIDGLPGQEQELVKLVNRLEEASTAHGMHNSAEKTQLMTNNITSISTDITIDNKKLDTVRS